MGIYLDLSNSDTYDFTEFHTCSFVALQMLNLFLMFTYTRWILKQVETAKTLVGNMLKEDKHC